MGMFTGITQDIGHIATLKKTPSGVEFTIRSKKIHPKKGDSISVNGACLTATKISKGSFWVDVIPETIQRTNFHDLCVGSLVNLEPSLRASDRLDGAFVLGHVDAVGMVTTVRKNSSGVYISIELPKVLSPFVAEKGSITINGVNLTVTGQFTLRKGRQKIFEVAIIPFTLKNTNLGALKKGDEVNLEADLIARYLYNFNHQ